MVWFWQRQEPLTIFLGRALEALIRTAASPASTTAWVLGLPCKFRYVEGPAVATDLITAFKTLLLNVLVVNGPENRRKIAR